jgi:hypothetical protein
MWLSAVARHTARHFAAITILKFVKIYQNFINLQWDRVSS